MSKPIPQNIYSTVERKLHSVRELQQIVTDELNSIFGTKPMAGQLPTRGSGHGDPTGNRAVRLADGTEESNDASAWLKAIFETRCFFAGAPEAELFSEYYGQGVTMEELAKRTGVSTKTYQVRRDNTVYRCAMHAALLGLIRLEAGA